MIVSAAQPVRIDLRSRGKAMAALEWSRARHQLALVRIELELFELTLQPDELHELVHAYRCELHNLALAEDIARRQKSRPANSETCGPAETAGSFRESR